MIKGVKERKETRKRNMKKGKRMRREERRDDDEEIKIHLMSHPNLDSLRFTIRVPMVHVL